MAFLTSIVKPQVVSLLNLAVRNTSGVPTYSSTLGDNTYATEEIDRAIQNAMNEVMRAICETDGHPQRNLFVVPTPVTHNSLIPEHLGSPGVPRIIPYAGCTYDLIGKRKSIEEIASYRANPNNLYCEVAHNASSGGSHSKLAGFYAIDKAANTIYFTGDSAEMDLAHFDESDFVLIPEMHYDTVIALSIKHLRKDGDVSNVFADYAQIGEQGLMAIRAKQQDQPSMSKTVGTRDSGTK